MQSQPTIISAKLKMPAPRRNYIPRAALWSRLARLHEFKVTVIQGAPGSGKTTLFSSYVSEHGPMNVRWICLDPSDNDPRILWWYILEALTPDLGERTATLRQLLGSSMQMSDVEGVLVDVVNALQPEKELFLVLDDAHYLTDTQALESLRFFLRYSSDRVHLVLLTRDNPQLYLGEVRMAGQLLEITNEDLKMTAQEGRAFLAKTLGVRLNEETIGEITKLAEGWIGGLQLLGVALDHEKGRLGSIGRLSQHVIEYLSGEIISSLSDEERRFLIGTSILPYFDEASCVAVLANPAAGQLLDQIFAKNLFLVVVDEERGLYRYHQLFKEFLQRKFIQLPEDERARLHRRAAEFYCAAGNLEDSVYHYLKAEDYDGALDLIGRMQRGVRSWSFLEQVPLDALEGRTDFIYQRLFSHFAQHQLEQCGEIIERFRGRFGVPFANRLFDLIASVIDNSPFELGPEEWSSEELRQLELSNETKAVLYSFVGVILTLKDQGREALECLYEADRIMGHVANPYTRYFAMELKSQVKEYMGDLRECEAIYDAIFHLVEKHPFLSPTLVTANIGAVGIMLETGQLDKAQACLDKVKGRTTPQSSVEAAYLYNLMKLHILRGETDAAAKVANRLLQNDVWSNRLYCAIVLRCLLHLDKADEWVLNHFQFEQIPAPQWHEYLLHARLLIRDERYDEALDLLNRRLAVMRKHQAKQPLVEALLLKVCVFDAEGESTAKDVQDTLREAVRYSYENHLIAPFVLESEYIAKHVRRLRDDTGAMLNPAEKEFLDELINRWYQSVPGVAKAESPSLLSGRETEVLQVLAQGATNKQIAERLYISIATVKTHMINIYSKLQVSNRVEAVEKARRHGFVD